MKKHYFLIGLLFSSAVFATSMNEAFNQGRDVGKGNNGNAQQIMKDFQPNQIQGFQARPQESQYYTGVKGENPNLMTTGMNALEKSESGKAIKDSIINNSKVKISQESAFIQSSNNIRNNAEAISGIKGEQCVSKVLSKTLFTSHFCEKDNLANLICTKTAFVKWNGKKELKEKKERFKLNPPRDSNKNSYSSIEHRNAALVEFYFPYKNKIIKDYKIIINWGESQYSAWNTGFFIGRPNRTIENVYFSLFDNVTSYISGKEKIYKGNRFRYMYPAISEYRIKSGINYKVDNPTYFDVKVNIKVCNKLEEPFCNGIVIGAYLKELAPYAGINIIPPQGFEIEITYLTEENSLSPTIEWVNTCSNQNTDNMIKLSEKCTQAGETRTLNKDGNNYSIHSDCWQITEEYLINDASDNECKKYEGNPNCTVGERECILQENGTCARHRVKYQCQTTTKTDGYICGDKFFCSDGSCADLESNINSDFGHAVSQLATLAQAGKDVGLDPEHLKAFSGKSMFCRKSGFGFSDCCKDSGWGNKAGLAKCNSEEKTLGQAKEKKLVVYVGTYCSRKVLGKCIQRKSGYCAFDNKLARIIQYQGRSGQLGIGFGGAKNPDCRGITVDELQRIDFNAMDYSDFYDELNERTNLPDRQQLMEHMKNSIIDQLQKQQ